MVQWLRLHISNAGSGSIPSQGTSSHMSQLSSHVGTKTQCSQINKYLKKKKVHLVQQLRAQALKSNLSSCPSSTMTDCVILARLLTVSPYHLISNVVRMACDSAYKTNLHGTKTQ